VVHAAKWISVKREGMEVDQTLDGAFDVSVVLEHEMTAENMQESGRHAA